MEEVKWIKLEVSLFENEKIRLIASEYSSKFDFILTTWLRLLCLAGKQNNKGIFTLPNGKPYKIENFSKLWTIRKDKLNLAFSILTDYGMIGFEDDYYFIKNWNKYQDLDKLEHKRKYDRERQQEIRAKARREANNTDESIKKIVRQSCDNRAIDIDIDKDIDIDNNIYINDTTKNDLKKCKCGFFKKEKNEWCFKNCVYVDSCEIKDNKSSASNTPDWFKEAQERASQQALEEKEELKTININELMEENK